MTKALLIAALSLAAPSLRADTFQQPLNDLLQKARFERGRGEWRDREREDRREYRERDRERGERLRNGTIHERPGEAQPPPPQERSDRRDPAPARRGWGTRHGDWEDQRRSGWRWDRRGYPLWWGWAAWAASARASCGAYYDSLETDCEIACGDERVQCADDCAGDDACVNQCRSLDNYCNQSCLDQRAEQAGLYCR